VSERGLLPRRFDRDIVGVGLPAALVAQTDVRLRDCPTGFDLTPHGRQLLDLDDLRAPVRVADESSAGCGHLGFSTCPDSRRLGAPIRDPLREPLADAPLVLATQHPAQLGELVPAVFEDAEDRFPLRNGQRDNAPVGVVAVFECAGGLVEVSVAEPAREIEHGSVGNGYPSEHHDTDHTFVSAAR
jgi:hypothetical protein